MKNIKILSFPKSVIGNLNLLINKAAEVPDNNTRVRQYKSAFTLIELLVVVLIVGILAAIALPQYQKAVEKSRYATLKAAATALTTAQQVFFLENGQYACNFDDLSLEIPSQANCYIISAGGCANWGCSLQKNNVDQITYYVESMKKYCVVWDRAPSILHDVCKSDTGRVGGRYVEHGGGYTEYAY